MSIDQEKQEKSQAPTSQRQPTTQQRQPAAQQPRSRTSQPSAARRPTQRQPGAQPTSRRQPPRRTAPRIRTYSPRQLEAMTSDITSFSNRLTALNHRTTQRLSRLAPSDSLPESRQYRLAGDYHRWQQLTRQHQDHPEDLAALVALADLQRRNHKFQEAEFYLLKTLALEPMNQKLLFDLGYLYLEKSENTKAWSTFQEIVYLNPGSIEARLSQGWVRENEGNYDGAKVIYTEVEERFGAVAGVYFHRVLNLVRRGDYGTAVALAREGLALYPDHAPLYYARGRAYAGLGLLDRAKTDFYDALSLDGDLLQAYAALGEVSLEEGNATTAVRAYLRLLDEQPGDATASLNLGRAYLTDLRFQEAVQEWEMLRYLHSDNREVDRWLPQAYYLLSLELKTRGRFREALDAYHKAMSLSSEQSPDWVVTALLLAGEAARSHDDYRRSLDYYRLAIENDPFRAESYVGLSRTYGAMQDSSRAYATLQQALAIDPDHPAARVEMNRIRRP